MPRSRRAFLSGGARSGRRARCSSLRRRGAQNRHVVTAAKEALVARRTGIILRSGDAA